MGNDYKRHAYRFLTQFGVETIVRCQAGQHTGVLRHFVKKYNAAHSTDITIRGGMARKVLIGHDFVIKLDWDKENVFCYGGCEDEIRLYKIAKEEGFAHLFAEITRITINEHNFYIMPRVHNVGRYSYSYADEFLVKEDQEFITKYVTDLHEENYGWYKGYPLIFDYAYTYDNLSKGET